MKLIRNVKDFIHVSSDTIKELEETILSDKNVQIANKIHSTYFKFVFFIFKVGRKIGFSTIFRTKKKYRNSPLKDKKHLFTVMMGLDIYKFQPYAFTTNHCRSIFLFDAWQKDYQKIVDFVRSYNIDFIFVTSSQSTDRLNILFETIKAHWIPEGINPSEYKFKDYTEKKIDVLALGRKYDIYHQLIDTGLTEKGHTYLYEKQKGELVFPTREDFIQGLAKTKISICVPSNITHPERSGDVETMTIRYLQSMVSKCLIVGYAPAEMIELFGYNPVVEIDMLNSVSQLDNILKNYTDYLPLIEKNYSAVLHNHTWFNRWNQIKNIWSNNSL